jgi:hypothetical protein
MEQLPAVGKIQKPRPNVHALCAENGHGNLFNFAFSPYSQNVLNQQQPAATFARPI